MNKVLKYTLLSIGGALIAAIIICTYIFGRSERGGIVCKRIQVEVTDSLEVQFISSSEIKKSIRKEYGRCIGESLDSIDLQKIETIIDNKSAVFKSQVFTTKDSTLHIEVTQRKPIVRFQKGRSGFYASQDGYIFPLQTSYAPHIQIVDGHIPVKVSDGHKGEIEDIEERKWVLDIIGLVQFIESNKDWRRIIVQIHVKENGDLVLVPREGDEKFIIGYPDHLEEKFEKLKKYYTAIVPKAGRNRYKVVDLRYREQIICK